MPVEERFLMAGARECADIVRACVGSIRRNAYHMLVHDGWDDANAESDEVS